MLRKHFNSSVKRNLKMKTEGTKKNENMIENEEIQWAFGLDDVISNDDDDDNNEIDQK